MLKLAAGIKMTHVPYAGMAPALNDLIAGHVEVMFDNLGNSLPLVQEGKLKGLAVTGDKRVPEVPDLPAIAETYPEVVATSLFTMVAPPKTPPEIADKLSQAFAEILHEPEVEKTLARDDADAGRRHARGDRRVAGPGDRALAQGHRRGQHQAGVRRGRPPIPRARW